MKVDADACAIVSVGCCLPGASNINEFWSIIRGNVNQIKPINPLRWSPENSYSQYREVDDKSYSFWGAEVELKNKINDNNESKLEIMTAEAFEQAVSGLKSKFNSNKTSIVLGVMNPDENYFYNRFQSYKRGLFKDLEANQVAHKLCELKSEQLLRGKRKSIDDIVVPTLIKNIKKRYQINGESYLVDAACASGVASVLAGMNKLKTRESDMVFVGGAESNLGQGAYVLFSKVGALATEKGVPFDSLSEGISQGEGAVVFAIQRIEDALRDGNKIWAIIKSIGSSSDGRVASLFQPSEEGQELALERAYEKIENKRLDYLELHGTGTSVGDRVELATAENFFKGYRTPVGSVKSLVGHTKAVAGAASILKSLLILDKQIIPQSHDVSNFILANDEVLFLNKNEIEIKEGHDERRIGISSFGFGGTNFHLVLGRSRSYEARESKWPEKFEVLILNEMYLSEDEFDEEWFLSKTSKYKLPPNSIKHIDKIQLLAVKAVDNMLNSLNIKLEGKELEEINVISASSLGLDVLDDIIVRISLDTLLEEIKRTNTDIKTKNEITDYLKNEKKKFIPAREDSAPGILNNVIAGRVCNAFNFKGMNLNIDATDSSGAAAIKFAAEEISLGNKGAFILVVADEKINIPDERVVRSGVWASILSSDEFARRHLIDPIKKVVLENGTL